MLVIFSISGKKLIRRTLSAVLALLIVILGTGGAGAWFDETHLAIAKAAGYGKWFNAAGADIARIKAGRREGYNHYSNHRRGETTSAAEVREQILRYDTGDRNGHLYGAIVASFRKAVAAERGGGYGHHHLAYCVHYIGDLSMPLHHTEPTPFSRKTHLKNDGIVNSDVLDNPERIRVYPIRIDSEADLIDEIVRIANLSVALGWRLEDENRLMTPEEAYRQLSHSASLLAALLDFFYGQIETK